MPRMIFAIWSWAMGDVEVVAGSTGRLLRAIRLVPRPLRITESVDTEGSLLLADARGLLRIADLLFFGTWMMGDGRRRELGLLLTRRRGEVEVDGGGGGRWGFPLPASCKLRREPGVDRDRAGEALELDEDDPLRRKVAMSRGPEKLPLRFKSCWSTASAASCALVFCCFFLASIPPQLLERECPLRRTDRNQCPEGRSTEEEPRLLRSRL
mmetsp:Transcript_10827/g.31011  ORF Transcript_10827/g.31011 Transcript_10827/m.31011 type:complete len:211 (+) Transcript_10827:227-859(+)